MGNIGIYNTKPQIAGDTFQERILTIKRNNSPIDLTGVLIKMQIKTEANGKIIKDLSIGNGITIIDALNGKFKIDSFLSPSQSRQYVYDIQITYTSGVVRTYLKGVIPIIQDISR
jgi:hypothetical protein